MLGKFQVSVTNSCGCKNLLQEEDQVITRPTQETTKRVPGRVLPHKVTQ